MALECLFIVYYIYLKCRSAILLYIKENELAKVNSERTSHSKKKNNLEEKPQTLSMALPS